MAKRLIFINLLFICFSCNRETVQWVNMSPMSTETENKDGLHYQRCDKEDFAFKISYVEDAFKYLIFHIELESFTKDTLHLKSENIMWSIDDDNYAQWHPVLDKKELQNLLREEETGIKKAKKSQTIANIIIAGIETLAIAVSPGGGLGALFYAAESGIYIAEDRDAFNVASLSVKDEEKYIEDWVLDYAILSPYEKCNFDILIQRNLLNQPLKLKGIVNNKTCEFAFIPEIIEERN